MLRTRIITTLVLVPLAAGLVFAGGIWFWGGVTVVALLAGWEFSQMMRAGGYHPTAWLSLGLIFLLVLDGYRPEWQLLRVGLSLALLLSLSWQLFQSSRPTPTADWALTVTGGLYVGWSMAHLVALRQLPTGLAWVWLALLATWGADILAYFVGRAVGRHKLWPRHSPHKSWEGLAGSIGGGWLGAFIASFFFPLSWAVAWPIATLIPIVGLFGDLSISMIKRQVGVKDSSNLLPGHGGFLDRIDSLLFVNIVVYYYAWWVG